MFRCPIPRAARLIAFAVIWSLGRGVRAQEPPRELSGTVVDQQHEPLRGAVVQVRDDKTQQVMSFITDKTGHYDFKRLLGGEDYDFWATYRGHRSHKRHLGMFDSQTVTKVNLAIRLQ